MPRRDFHQLLDQAIGALRAPSTLVPTSIPATALLLLHEGEGFFVALILHLLQWNKAQSGRFHGVALPGRRSRIRKEMTEVGIASLGANIDALHPVRIVRPLDQKIL